MGERYNPAVETKQDRLAESVGIACENFDELKDNLYFLVDGAEHETSWDVSSWLPEAIKIQPFSEDDLKQYNQLLDELKRFPSEHGIFESARRGFERTQTSEEVRVLEGKGEELIKKFDDFLRPFKERYDTKLRLVATQEEVARQQALIEPRREPLNQDEKQALREKLGAMQAAREKIKSIFQKKDKAA